MASDRGSDARRDFLFIQSTTELGGAERVLLNVFEASQELRRRSIVATLGFGDGELPSRLRAVGTEVLELKIGRLRHPWKLVSTLATLRACVRGRGIRVVVGNGGHPQIVAGLVARLSGARSAFIVHAIYPHPLSTNDALDRVALLGPCDMAIAVSDAARQAIGRLRPRVPNRLVHNGTPFHAVSPDQALSARRELGAADGDLLVGCFGRLQHWKGQDVFVQAAGQIARQYPGCRFAIVGGATFGLEPEYFDGLKRAAADLGVAERLVFTGFRTDVPRLMAACDVICHTSRVPEPFGLVVIEAMALGRPTIATRGGGPSEIIASPSQGTLVPPDDPGALARAVSELIEDPERRRRIGAAGRERVQSTFTIDAAARNLIGCLDELASSV